MKSKRCENPECGIEFEARDKRVRFHDQTCQKKMHAIEDKAKRDADLTAFHAYQAAYREKNRDRINTQARERYQKPHIKEQERERRNRPEARGAQSKRNRAWKLAHPERVRELGLADYYRHKDKRNAKSKEWYAQRTARLEAARRPDDWQDKPIEWRIIGTELLSTDYMSNKALAKRLDQSRIITCPYGESWDTSVTLDHCKKFINKIRKWVGRQGRTIASIPLAPPA